MKTSRRLPLLRALLALAAFAALALPASAAAIEVEIVNESGRPDNEVWITVASPEPAFGVTQFTKDVPKQLSEVTNHRFEVTELTSGRIFVAYGSQGVHEGVPFSEPIRFDWAELTTGGVANLTAVDQFAIGMRLETLNGSGQTLETIGEANSDTVFDALQNIPGGPQSTVRGPNGEILRVLSPTHSSAYPLLGEYVRSMAGQTIALHSTFSAEPIKGMPEFDASDYTGTFAPDGTVTLTGITDPPGKAPAQITIPGAELLQKIYTAANTPNDLEGSLLRDLYVGFVGGFWGGRYGNDSAAFCPTAVAGPLGPYCEHFNQPSYGSARAALSPFPTCEQYAAVINQFSDSYGNPFSDGFKDTVVQIGAAEDHTLRLTILPDAGSAGPVHPGNPNCGAGPAAPTSTPRPAGPIVAPHPHARVAVHAKLLAHTTLSHGKLRVARLHCATACGRVRAVIREGKRVVARGLEKRAGKKGLVVARLTKPGRRLLAGGGKHTLRLDLWVAPPGQRASHFHDKLIVKG
jgi:hypothetical protein